MIKTQILHNDEILEGNFEDLKRRHTTVWVDIADPDLEQLRFVASHMGVGAEELSELLHPNQRPILQDIGNFTGVVFQSVEIQKSLLSTKTHLLLASKEQKDFISLHPGISAAVEKINTYSAKRKVEIFRKGSTALLFAALNEMVSSGFDILDYISDEVGKLEEQVFKPQLSSSVMKQMFQVKKGLINFQRTFSADREVISAIEKAYGGFLDAKQLSSFRLLYSDVTQLIELSTTYRDIMISTLEVHLSAISNNLNVVMKRLTAWAAIILVPSLLAGIYGMNFLVLPYAKDPFGFWYVVGAMLVLVILLYSYFKHHDWI